ncbi:MAG: hypothetical protein ACOYJD_04360 [Christensenellales bacterium]|jgi:hypothetical protein
MRFRLEYAGEVYAMAVLADIGKERLIPYYMDVLEKGGLSV